jgi:hypothetical protein
VRRACDHQSNQPATQYLSICMAELPRSAASQIDPGAESARDLIEDPAVRTAVRGIYLFHIASIVCMYPCLSQLHGSFVLRTAGSLDPARAATPPPFAAAALNALISPFARATMGHTVEHRLGGAGRAACTCQSRGYRSKHSATQSSGSLRESGKVF